MPTASSSWLPFALGSAFFAALTAILAKVGLKDVDSDLATWVRTLVILAVLSVFLAGTGKWSNPLALPARTWLFLALSGVATGASWVCYFRALKAGSVAQVAPVDKLSLALALALAFAFLGERPSPREWVGAALVLAGVLVFSWKK